ncbi:MAG: GNAT family N-acetyltransferase [Ignavibacteria bacterium]|nr:GNAT family N-acetyltransferase [Ignavibacteria bacterium]
MVNKIRYITAKTKKDYEDGKKLILEYAASLNFDLCFQNFKNEINNLEKEYGFPGGCLVLARIEGEGTETIGVVGLRKYKGKTCELKRMYVIRKYRNYGIGKDLLKRSIRNAKKMLYQKIRLDTLETMTAAIGLYKNFGFKEIKPYRYNPIATAKYFELDL